MDNSNIFTGKTVEEAVQLGLETLGLTKEEAEISILDEGKKGIFGLGASKAKVSVSKRASDGQRAAKFVDGLFEILKINAVTEIVADDEKVEINVEFFWMNENYEKAISDNLKEVLMFFQEQPNLCFSSNISTHVANWLRKNLV